MLDQEDLDDVADEDRLYPKRVIYHLRDKSDEPIAWAVGWQKTGLILWMDDGDGRVRYSAGLDNEIFRSGNIPASDLIAIDRSHRDWLDSGGAQGADARLVLRSKGLSGPDRDIIVLATPEMAELANWIIALVAAGGLAAVRHPRRHEGDHMDPSGPILGSDYGLSHPGHRHQL